MSVTPMDASARVCAGVDWAKDDHAVCIVDADGEVLDRFIVEHTAAGLKRLVSRLLKAGVAEVGIERGDGPVVEALLTAELVVLVIAPNQLKNLRSRYGSAGNKDDRFDAYVLADVIRTDRRRLTPLTRSTPGTIALRNSVRARRDLVEHRRDHLARAAPLRPVVHQHRGLRLQHLLLESIVRDVDGLVAHALPLCLCGGGPRGETKGPGKAFILGQTGKAWQSRGLGPPRRRC